MFFNALNIIIIVTSIFILMGLTGLIFYGLFWTISGLLIVMYVGESMFNLDFLFLAVCTSFWITAYIFISLGFLSFVVDILRFLNKT